MGGKIIHRPERTYSGFSQIFIELCGSKVQLAPLHGNFSNGATNPNITYFENEFGAIENWKYHWKRITLKRNLLDEYHILLKVLLRNFGNVSIFLLGSMGVFLIFFHIFHVLKSAVNIVYIHQWIGEDFPILNFSVLVTMML